MSRVLPRLGRQYIQASTATSTTTRSIYNLSSSLAFWQVFGKSVPYRAAAGNKMSTSAAPRSKNEWLVILPDRADGLERRLKARSSGYINWGGVMLDDHVPDSQGRPQFKGSVLMFVADTKEEVLKMIEEDEYTKNEVWDKEKIEIYPFRTAMRSAIEQ